MLDNESIISLSTSFDSLFSRFTSNCSHPSDKNLSNLLVARGWFLVQYNSLVMLCATNQTIHNFNKSYKNAKSSHIIYEYIPKMCTFYLETKPT